MVYDNKETLMDRDGRFFFADEEETVVSRYELDYEGLEAGKRYLAVPEGIRCLTETAFGDYNGSDVILSLQNKLVNPGKARDEWLKRLRSNRIIKITFPSEVGNSYYDKAEFMRKKELRIRFLRIALPSTYEEYQEGTLPDLLERIVVAEENPYFKAVEGVLFSKDGKTLLRYPGFRDEQTDYVVPEDVERIVPGAFKNCVLTSLTLPAGVELEAGVFENSIIDELILPPDLKVLPGNSFLNCDLRRLVLPAGLETIADYAFRGVAGISEIVTNGCDPALGSFLFEKGYFRDIGWWPWKTIPEACFANAELKHLHVPAGVERINDHAFAGCYQAKEVVLPESVCEIAPASFDLGDTVSAQVTVPAHLLKFAYRFPALTKVNKLTKSKAWEQRDDRTFAELTEVLEKQRQDMQKYVNTLGVLQSLQKAAYHKEIAEIDRLLAADPARPAETEEK
ncbi:MAG: leucine-rich repeat domain-containing protein [Clostridia bacterium]|nr:leucine-rich repeat domain-containing protein [Clostridia bacterium]